MVNYIDVGVRIDAPPYMLAGVTPDTALVSFHIGGAGEGRMLTLASSDPHVLHDALTAAAVELEKAVIRFENEKQS